MKFRLVESIYNDIYELYDRYVLPLSTEEIISEARFEQLDHAPEGPSFILPNGKFVNDGKEMHDHIISNMVHRLIGYFEELPNATYDLMYNHLIDDLGWVKANTGTSASDNRCYFVIPPAKKNKLTNAQYNSIEEVIEIGEKEGTRDDIQIYGGEFGRAQVYSLNDYSPSDIVKKIRRYYSGGYFVESTLNEVYPNKGEPKKDFISRFMSVTKDEYPDRKQRLAIAYSYWDRRNKKKNESVNDSVDVVAYHGSQDDNISLRDEPIYLTNNIDLAKDFAKGYAFGYHLLEDDSPTVYKMRVTFNNPLIIHTEEEYEDIMDIVNIEKTVSMLKENGNDGVIFRDEEADYYMPVSAKNQCKILDKIEMIND